MSDWALAPILGSRHVNNSVTWYCDQLGFTCENGVFQGVGDESGVYGIIQRDGIQLHIQIRRRDLFPKNRQSIESEVYLFVADAGSLYEEFSQKDVNIIREIQKGPNYALQDFVVEDPDGNRLIFGSPI